MFRGNIQQFYEALLVRLQLGNRK